ncbi:MAG: TetR/AcrR family transcriptional regulator [Holophagales bacterium]|nr:TetR/AcrR family transcriptional regulator [Holophagales bacterium]
MKRSPRVRTYRMGVRAEAAAATHRCILEVAIRLLGDRFYDEVSLAEVARGAGVTVQTVLRRFGSKEGLTEAATALGVERVRAERWSSPPGDLDDAVRGLLAHYEAWGDRSLRFLAQEQRVAAMGGVVRAGRALHHDWVDHAFEPWLARKRGAMRARLRARLIAVTDVYVWKIVRRDLGLDERAAEATLRELVAAVVA